MPPVRPPRVSPCTWSRHRPAPTVGLVALLLAGSALGQAPPVATPAANPAAGGVASPPRTVPFNDLTNRYRFLERYPREDGRELPGALGPYRVALTEVIREVVDQPQGAPRRSETTRRSVFVERTSEAASLGGVVGSVRFVETYDARPDDPRRAMGATPLDGLALALRYRVADWPFLVPLADRKPTDHEAEVVTRQMAVAQLGLVLPGQPIRVGDTWHVSRRGAQALLGEPGARGDTLVGKFTELRKEEDGPRLVALLAITGKVAVAAGEAAVNAEVVFPFQPEAPAPSGAGGRAVEGVLEARGGITEVRLGRSTGGPLAGPGRLRFQATREVTMNRQFLAADQVPSLPKLPPSPKPDDPATWLVYVDPARRFRVEHPQDFAPPEQPLLAPTESGSAVLVRARREGTDLIQIDHAPRTLAPEDLKAKLAAKYALTKAPVTKGDEGWLAEDEWPGRRVYRMEAAVAMPSSVAEPGAPRRPTRVHFDGYLIQSAQSGSFLVVATTSREPIAPIRREIERCLQTLSVDPDVPLQAPAPATSAAPPVKP